MPIKLNRLIKVFWAFGALLVVAFVFLAFYIRLQGREIVRARLEAVLGRPVEIGDVRLSLPFDLRLGDVRVGDVLKARAVILGVGFINPLTKEINLSQLTLLAPQVFINQSDFNRNIPEPAGADPVIAGNPPPDPSAQMPSVKKSPLSLSVDKLFIRDGGIHLVSESPDRRTMVVKDVNVVSGPLSFPLRSLKTDFTLKALLEGIEAQNAGARIDFAGWIDFFRKDMDGRVSVDGLDSSLLFAFFGGEENVLKNAVVDVTADLKAVNNDMDVRCRLKVKSLNFNVKDDQNPSLENIIIQGLTSIGQDIEMGFNFKTKMDDFKLETISFSGSVGKPVQEPASVDPQGQAVGTP